MIYEIIKAENYEEMSTIAAKRIIGTVTNNSKAVLGLATGSTPEGMYQLLIKDYQNNGTSYKHIKTVNLDEYIGLPKEDKNSYFTFMRQHLFNHIDIDINNTNLPNGMARNMEEEAIRYEKHIHEIGGVDLQILGIGHNGHIGFNEPGTPFSSKTHIIELTSDTRQANARFFTTIEEVPTYAITMGIQSILDSKEIILLASGVKKAQAMKRLLSGDISEDFPASALRIHKHVTIIADKDALSLI